MHEIVRRTEEGTLDPWWVINGLQNVVEGEKKAVRSLIDKLSTYKFVTAITLPEQSRFVASEQFVVDVSDGATVKIAKIDPDFLEVTQDIEE